MKKLYYLLSLLLLTGCKTDSARENIEKISITLDKIDNEAVFSDYSYIKLETNEDCLLENITKADISDNYIYLLSSFGGNIYKFSKGGDFLWKLNKGNGAGELIFPTDFMFDESSNTLLVLDNYRSIKKYTTDGKFIGKEEFESPAFLFESTEYGYIQFNPNLTTNSSHYIHAYQDSNIIFKGLPIKENVKKVAFMPSNVFVKLDKLDEYYIQHMLSDTIYRYRTVNNEIIPAFYIDTENKSINSQDIKFPDSRSFQQISQNENLIPGVSGLFVLGKKLYLMMNYREKQWYIAYNQDDKTTTVRNRLCLGLPNSLRCVSRELDFVAYAYRPEELYEAKEDLGEKATIMLENIKIDDNPILIIFN